MIRPGVIVRYKKEWCNPGERYYLHKVIENRLNPVTGELSRWLIQTINMKNMAYFAPTEEVEGYMIEPAWPEESADPAQQTEPAEPAPQ